MSSLSKGGTEQILIVEDDDEVRQTAADMLVDLGYSVLKAKDADAALAIIESGAAHRGALHRCGDAAQAAKLGARPQGAAEAAGIAVLFTSGYTNNAILHGDRLDEASKS